MKKYMKATLTHELIILYCDFEGFFFKSYFNPSPRSETGQSDIVQLSDVAHRPLVLFEGSYQYLKSKKTIHSYYMQLYQGLYGLYLLTNSNVNLLIVITVILC